jgi:Telomere resolvase ResT/TelK catalytic domain
MAAKWLVKRWAIFFPAIEQAGTEAEIEALCKAEVQAWREESSIKQESSLRNPMNESRNEVRKRLHGDLQEWTLKHLAFSQEWYKKHNAPSRVALENRLEHQQLMQDPDAIIAKGVELLTSQEWADIAVGLAVCTGRRPGEVLKTAIFELKSGYTMIFTGQLKRGEREIPPYEIPTLCTAAAAIDALARLRGLLPTSEMDVSTVTNRYSPFLQDAANRHFAQLIPVREGKDGLYGHLFRSVYARLAVFWYAPPSVADTHYMATIQGHTDFFEAETEEARRSYASSAHYSDYKIADPDGNIDGRQGLKLGTRDVELLEVFKPKSRRKDPVMTTTETQDETTQETKPEGKSRPITVDHPTFNREMAFKTRLGHRTHAQTINFLMDSYEQGGSAQAGAKTVADAIRSVLSKDPIYQKFQKDEETAPAAAVLEQALAESESLQALLVDALIKEAKFRVGLTKRHAGKDFAGMTTSQLTNTKHPEAAKERIRRAVVALAAYNDKAVVAERWYINARTIQILAGARYPIVEEYFKEHQAEIDAANAKHELNQRYNSKAYSIKTVVTIPEQAEQPVAEAETPEEPEQAEVEE